MCLLDIDPATDIHLSNQHDMILRITGTYALTVHFVCRAKHSWVREPMLHPAEGPMAINIENLIEILVARCPSWFGRTT